MSGKYFLNSFFAPGGRAPGLLHWTNRSSIAILILMVFSGCRGPQPVSSTIYKKDSVIERERLVPIHIPASQVNTHIGRAQYDSLVAALQSMPAGHKTIVMTDPLMQTRLSLFLDSLGQLSFKCESLEKIYQAKLVEKDRIIESFRKDVVKERKPFFQELWEKVQWIVFVIALFLVGGAIVFIKSKL